MSAKNFIELFLVFLVRKQHQLHTSSSVLSFSNKKIKSTVQPPLITSLQKIKFLNFDAIRRKNYDSFCGHDNKESGYRTQMYETMQQKYKNVAIQAPLATLHKAHPIHQSLIFNTVVCAMYLTSNQQK